MLAYLCGAAVGIVFLVTAFLKSVDSRAFLEQIGRYGLLKNSQVFLAGLAFIVSEWLIGAALVLGLTDVAIPVAAALLACLAGLTAWATLTKRVEDCGCYGGVVLITPWQSIALDGVYIALLAAAWGLNPDFDLWAPISIWRLVLTLAIGLAGGGLAYHSFVRPRLIELTPLKPGRAWGRKWMKAGPRDVTTGAHFVVFLSKDCSYCKNWVPLLNIIEVQPDFPQVMGIMSLEESAMAEFNKQHLIHFPIAYMQPAMVKVLVDAFPTAALVENGKIIKKWKGEMPKEYVDRIRQFYEAIARPQPKTAGTFSG